MNVQRKGFTQLPKQSGRLLLIGLATMLMVALGSQWVSAKSPGNNGFTSPLGTPHAHEQRPQQLLNGIINRDKLTAQALGITVEALEAARQNGTHLDELITQLGLDEATVHQAIEDAFTAAIQQAVTDGTLTQEQATQLLNRPTPNANGGGQHHNPSNTPGANGENGDNGRPPHPQEQPTAQATEGGTIPPVATSESGGGTVPPIAATPDAPPAHNEGHRPPNGDQPPPQRPQENGGGQGNGAGQGNGGQQQRPGR